MKTSKKEAKLIGVAISGIKEVANEDELSNILETHWKVIDSGLLKGRSITGGYVKTTRVSNDLTVLQTTVFGPHKYGSTQVYLVEIPPASISKMLDTCWKWHTSDDSAKKETEEH